MNGCDLEALSAYCDGELEGAELAARERHLRECAACRNAAREFREVDRLLALRGGSSVRAVARRRRLVLGTAATLAAAAVLAAALLFPRRGPDVLAVPVANLEILNEQSLGDQQALLETYAWELRALQLEVECMGQNPGSRDLRRRTDALLARVAEVRDGAAGARNRGGRP